MIETTELRRRTYAAGFTLVELLVVMAITAILSTVLVISFSGTTGRVDLEQAVGLFVADIRDAQSRALYGAEFPPGVAAKPRCGYGLRRVSGTQYQLYTGPDSTSINCTTEPKQYQAGQDTVVASIFLKDSNGADPKLEFVGWAQDIFFEPPDPKVYFQNLLASGATVQSISIRKFGTAGCTVGNCKVVDVYGSGRIEVHDP